LADSGIPDLMKVIGDLTKRMTSAIQVKNNKISTGGD